MLLTEVSVIIPILIILALAIKIIKKFNISLFIILCFLIYFYFRNIYFLAYTITAFSMSKSIGDKKIKTIVSVMFNDLFILKTDFTNLPEEKTIFVANYSRNYYDCFATMLIPKNLAIIIAKNFSTMNTWNKILYNTILKDKKNNESSYDMIKNQIKNCLNKNLSVLGYVSIPQKGLFFPHVRTGLFRIAKELNVKITPVVFDTINICNFRINKQKFQIYIGESFYVNEVEKDVKKVKKLFKQKNWEFKKNKPIS